MSCLLSLIHSVTRRQVFDFIRISIETLDFNVDHKLIRNISRLANIAGVVIIRPPYPFETRTESSLQAGARNFARQQFDFNGLTLSTYVQFDSIDVTIKILLADRSL